MPNADFRIYVKFTTLTGYLVIKSYPIPGALHCQLQMVGNHDYLFRVAKQIHGFDLLHT